MSYSTFVQYDKYYVDYQGLQKANIQYPVLNRIHAFSSALSSKQFSFMPLFGSTTMRYQATIEYFQKIGEIYQKLDNKLNKIRSKYLIYTEPFIYKIVKAYTNILKPKPFSKFTRTYPSLDANDSMHFGWSYRELLNSSEQELFSNYLSTHPYCEYRNRLISRNMYEIGLSYKDEQIVRVHPLISSSDNQVRLYRGMTEETGKHVFQQKGLKSGFIACVYMLLCDHSEHYLNNRPNHTYLNITNYESMMRFLNEEIARHPNTDLQAIRTRVKSFEEFKEKLEMHGSACIKVNSDTPRMIIVDRINKENTEIDIRDPFHGWAITITAEAFLNTSGLLRLPLELIQITKG